MALKKAKHVTLSTQLIPHSWLLARWDSDAAHVAPGSAKKAKYLFRMHRDELLAAGAVARVGRDIIFFGAQYDRFLRRNASRVPDYEIAANREARASAEA